MNQEMTEQKIQDLEDNEKIGRWTVEEHKNFLQGFQLHGKCWKKVASHVKTRTVVQVRTHAQKYFLKLQKSGDGVGDLLKLSDETKRPQPMIKKCISPLEVFPVLQSFNLLSRNSSQEKDFFVQFQFPSSDLGIDSAPVAVVATGADGCDGDGNGNRNRNGNGNTVGDTTHADSHFHDNDTEDPYTTPTKQAFYKEADWFSIHHVSTEYSEGLTDGSESGSDRKSSFDSTEDEDNLHLEFTAPPIFPTPSTGSNLITSVPSLYYSAVTPAITPLVSTSSSFSFSSSSFHFMTYLFIDVLSKFNGFVFSSMSNL